MHRLLERLDEAASTLVPLLYLAGLAMGTIVYFTDVHIGALLAVGVSLALAAEVHSFLAQRRLRALWGQYTRSRDDDTREALHTQLWVQGAILAGLVAFSCYNSIAFVVSTWTPAPGWLPAPVQVAIRGAIVPALFLLTGFLSPLSVDAGALLASASRDMLRHTLKTTVKQWRARIKRARKRNLNLAPVAVALMLDAGDTDGARRVGMIDAGLAYAENGGDAGEALALTSALTPAGIFTPTPTATPTPLAPVASSTAPDRDTSSPTGGPGGGDDPTPTGGPGGAPPRKGGKGGARRSASASPDAILRLVSGEPATPRPHSGMTRADQEALWHADMTHARALLAREPGLSTRELARRLSVGRVYTCYPGRATAIRRALQSDTGEHAALPVVGEARARA